MSWSLSVVSGCPDPLEDFPACCVRWPKHPRFVSLGGDRGKFSWLRLQLGEFAPARQQSRSSNYVACHYDASLARLMRRKSGSLGPRQYGPERSALLREIRQRRGRLS
jgi:hypothetical protein